MDAPSATQLKDRLRALRDTGMSPDTGTRLHRAISWIARAEQEADDPDARYIFLWIALNAAYAREMGTGETERSRFREFIEVVVVLDEPRRLHDALFKQFSGPIRTLIENRFVFEPFWTALRTHDGSGRWEERFTASRKSATEAIVSGETASVLAIVFDRLYVLRNQLVHGGATWGSSVNREQVRDGVAILGTLVPRVVEIMLECTTADFGEVLYPVT